MVYTIICNKCRSTVYVEETERELQNRMTEHLRDVQLRKDKPINFHFGIKGHTQNDMAFAVLERCMEARGQLKEGIWIKKLSTVRPHGCNVKDSYIPVEIQ